MWIEIERNEKMRMAKVEAEGKIHEYREDMNESFEENLAHVSIPSVNSLYLVLKYVL